MATQGVRAVIRSGESAKNLGAPEAEYHIYVDSVNGDDDNEGFGTNDPTDAANWAKAVQTGDKARLMVPRSGRTIMHTQGDLTFNGDYFPYRGYTGELWCVSYDEMEVVATGVVNTVNASTDAIPWGEMTVTWGGGYGPTDAELRTAWLNVEYDDTTIRNHKILEWTDPGAGGLGVRVSSDISGDTSPGNSVTVAIPRSTLTFANGRYAGFGHMVLNASFVGYKITNDVGTGDYYFFFDSSGSPTQFALCSLDHLLYPASGSDWFDTAVFGSITAQRAGMSVYLRGAVQLTFDSGCYVRGGGYPWSVPEGSILQVYSSTIEELSIRPRQLAVAYITETRIVEGVGQDGLEPEAGGIVRVNNSKIACLSDAHGTAIFYLTGAIGLNTLADSAETYQGKPALLRSFGSRTSCYGTGQVFVEGPAADVYAVVLIDSSSAGLEIDATLDLATPGAPLPSVVIDAGDHGNLQIDCDAMDRGVGPLAVIKGNASVDLEKAVGTNSNAGNGYGLFVDEKAFVRADKSDCTMSGTAGELKVGTLAVQAFPADGDLVTDLTNPPAPTDTLAMVKGY